LGAFLPFLAGCGEDKDSANARKAGETTVKAVQTAVKDQNYASARDKVASAKRGVSGLSGDTARLATGNMWLAQARQSQFALELKVLPLQSTSSAFEAHLRDSESLLLEKERVSGLLSRGQSEVAELQALLSGDGQTLGLIARYDQAKTQLTKLTTEKKAVADKMAKAQSVLDDYQGQADALQRKSELTTGDQRLKLEKDSFAILYDRKEYYIKFQAAENEISVLEDKVALSQTSVDGLNTSIQQTRQRIDAINNSDTMAALKRQANDIDGEIREKQQRMSSIASDLSAGLNTYKNEADEVCEEFQNAAGEFEMVRQKDVKFTASLRTANSYHGAANTAAASIIFERNMSGRLQNLTQTADPTIISSVQQKLPVREQADAEQVNQAFEYFDKAIEAYDKAFSATGGLTSSLATADKAKGRQAKSGVLKSQLLAIDSKMKLARHLEDYDKEDAASAQLTALTEKGAELGVSFTQSETLKLIEYGINYEPSLPINLEVYADDLKRKLSEWKRLPVAKQEAAVESNLRTIDDAVTRYGEELAGQLEPLKQEMLAAQKRGFKEDSSGGDAGGPADPNTF
jgi:hypothetical protein